MVTATATEESWWTLKIALEDVRIRLTSLKKFKTFLIIFLTLKNVKISLASSLH
jgi:hypothetical protein